jgi:hypothetical protein
VKKLLVLLVLVSSTAFAANVKDPGGYGMAGCGLGSMVFPQHDSTQILAATTNGTFGTQTFGITFGTSNCGSSGKLFSKEEVQNYIAANEPALKNDIARGNGETVDGLANIMGAKDVAQFRATLKANYSKLFAKNDVSPQELTNNVYSVLN